MELPSQLLVGTSVLALVAACLYQQCWGARSPQRPRYPGSDTRDQQRFRELTLRVDEIPTGTSAAELESELQSILAASPDLQDQLDGLAVRSLTPRDCTCACATITARTRLLPDQLLARLHHASKKSPYRFDCTFYGITPLYEDPAGVHCEYAPPFL